MPRTNQEIQQEYAGKGALAKLGIAADDIVRIAASGLTGGLIDDVLGGGNSERTREARVRAGLAGDVANVGGMVAGLKGAGGLVRAVRSIPRPAVALTRGAMAKGAGVLGLLGLSVAGRQEDTAPAAVSNGRPDNTPLAKSLQVARDATLNARDWAANIPEAPTPAERATAVADAILSRPHTLREAQAAVGLLPAPSKQTAKDRVFATYSSIADSLFAEQLAQASKISDPQKAAEAKSAATREYLRNVGAALGSSPAAMLTAEQLAAAQSEMD